MKNESLPFFYNAQDLGKSFREVSVDYIQSENQNIINHWYHSSKDADLFVWMDSDRNIIKQQLSFYGQIIEWNIVEGLRTGCLMENEQAVGHRKPADVIRYDAKPQSSSLSQAADLLRHIEVLRSEDRQILVDNFIFPQKSLPGMGSEEFVRKFGRALSKNPKVKASSWARFVAWLKSSLGCSLF